MRVAVFGATGVVGWSLVAALREDPDKRVDAVIGLARRLPANPQPNVDWRQVDLDHDDLASHLQGVDAVVNVAWDHARGEARGEAPVDNVARARRLLEAVVGAGVRHVVQASSFAAYAPAPRLHDPIDETWPIEGVADVPYARQMVALERALAEFAGAHEIVRLVTIRSGVVLGPGAVAQLAARLGPLAPYARLPGHVPFVPGIEGIALPVVHHDDLAAAYRAAVTGTAMGPYNVALEAPLDLAAVARVLDARPLAIPASAATKAAEMVGRLSPRRPGEWLELGRRAPLLDSSRARHDLRWSPNHPLDDALRTTLTGR